jgi:hypothetical protein
MPTGDGNYVTLQEIRDQGVTSSMASDSQIASAIADAERDIESWTGRWFYRKTGQTLKFDGGVNYYVYNSEYCQQFSLPVPIINLTGITIDDQVKTLTDFIVFNRIGPPMDDRWNPRIVSKFRDFPLQGMQNIWLIGDFGFVEETTTYAAPRRIKIATKLLVIKHYLELKLITDIERDLEKREAYITEEKIPGHDVKIDKSYLQGIPKFVGDPEIDDIIWTYKYKVKSLFTAV